MTTGSEPPKNTPAKSKSTASTPDHDHEHDHAHEEHDHDGHSHGPHGGHIVHLEPSGSHAEWAHEDETGKITVYVGEVEELGKKVQSVKINLNIGDQPTKTYDLKASDKSAFELTSPELLTAIEMTGAAPTTQDSKNVSKDAPPTVKATLIISIDGKEQTASIVEDDHGHHH